MQTKKRASRTIESELSLIKRINRDISRGLSIPFRVRNIEVAWQSKGSTTEAEGGYRRVRKLIARCP